MRRMKQNVRFPQGPFRSLRPAAKPSRAVQFARRRLRQFQGRQVVKQFALHTEREYRHTREDLQLLQKHDVPIQWLMAKAFKHLPDPGLTGVDPRSVAIKSGADHLRAMEKSDAARCPGDCVVLMEYKGPNPNFPSDHLVVKTRQGLQVVPNVKDGFSRLHPFGDFFQHATRRMFLIRLGDKEAKTAAAFLGIPEHRLLLLETPDETPTPMTAQMSRRRPVVRAHRGRLSDADCKAELIARGINPDLMPNIR